MMDPFVTSVNSELAALNWFGDLSENVSNIYTPGYREKKFLFSDYINGTMYQDDTYKAEQGKALPGRAPSNLFIDGKGYFVMRKPDGSLVYTRLGDFKYDAGGSLVSDSGYKVQGYMTDEKGNILNTGATQSNPGGSPNNPNHTAGGPGHMPTTEINLWVDPSNGKYFGKYDEYKVKADGTVMGLANEGKTSVPLYKIALVNFPEPGAMYQVDNYYFVPTAKSGQPVEGSGEIMSGLIEKSNTSLREDANYLLLAKVQLDTTSKLISTNKQLLSESLRLIQ